MSPARQTQTPPADDEFAFADGWRPEPGDVVRGKVAAMSTGHSSFGSYPIVTVKQDDGTEIAVHAFHTALRNRFAEIRPTIGAAIAVKYLGEVTPKNGGLNYHGYVVKSDTAPEGFWDRHPSTMPADEPEGDSSYDDGEVPF